MQTISSCASSYDHYSLCNYSVKIWDSLKYEIINIQEQELEKEALGALQAIATTLSHSSSSTKPNSPLAQYLRPIIKECNLLLQEPQQKRAKPAAQILYTLSVTSASALFLVVNGVVPPSIIIYETEETIPKKTALLEVFTKLIDSAYVIEMKSEGSEVPAELRNPLAPFKDRLYELASSALMGGSSQEMPFRVAAVKLLFHLCSLRHCLQQNEIGLIVKYFCELVLSEDPHGKGDLKAEAAQALVGISKVRPSLVQDISLPEFISRLPDSSVANNSDYLTVLEGLVQLSVEQSIADILARRLLKKLELVLEQDSSPAYPRALLSTLFCIWNRGNEFEPPTMDLFYEKVVISFISQAAQASAGCAPITALNDESVMEALGRLANLIVRRADADKQQFVGSRIYSLFTSESDAKPLPCRPDSSKEQRMTMVLSAWLMASVRSIVRSPSQDASIVNMLTEIQVLTSFADVTLLLPKLVELALNEDIPIIRQSILRQIALITNKFLPPTQIHYTMDILRDTTNSLVENKDVAENTVRVLFWIAKALVLRLAETEEVLERLMSLLSDVRIGLSIGRGFGILLAPDELLSKQNGAIIRLLANQRVFTYCIPKLAKFIRQADDLVKRNYLIALSGILKYTGNDILMTDVDTLLPLLLQSLNLEASEVKSATIRTLIIISQQSVRAIEGHVSSVVNRLLESAICTKTNDQVSINPSFRNHLEMDTVVDS